MLAVSVLGRKLVSEPMLSLCTFSIRSSEVLSLLSLSCKKKQEHQFQVKNKTKQVKLGDIIHSLKIFL